MKKYFLLFISFGVLSASQAQVADSIKRHVALQGASNFRDLGGYTTADGHHVKWGQIYRSADMSKLTDADLVVLKERKITYDVDLRGNQESAQAPDRINPGTDYILSPAGSDGIDWMKTIAKLKGDQGDSVMNAYYGNTQFLAERYKIFFDKLLKLPQDNSLVFHCTAGKDRTGIGAALLLYSLGVPYDTIMDDYLASNYYRRADNIKMVNQMVKYAHIDEQVAKNMAGVKKEFLDTTFKAITSQYGSVDNFLKTQVGLDDQKIGLLKKKFLE
ncbi:protein-tyrosine phosphatase [Mucilaginibacter lappiensis]|uniref:Protein-tyrosine phosphatase n=1 Tax=Mucilaginibacter lappiensis TaxID=354630 RepID=A0ABR6PCR3_9SPHI|nr:tyrosine-protein phosphatase [Mucilaginibacter lappiensis]MBB6107539.1 protein-tyrosine phosphatase [Mucilaginibacter lappiensis]